MKTLRATFLVAAVVVFLVALSVAAFADNCTLSINPQDCQNTAWPVGTTAAGAGAAAAATIARRHGRTAQRGKPAGRNRGKPSGSAPPKRTGSGKTTNRDTRQFANCNEAVNHIRNQQASGGHTADAHVEIHPTLGQMTVTQLPDGSYRAEASVTFGVDPSSTMTIPDYSWPNMTPADHSAMQAYVDAVRAHEEGHFTVAEQKMAQLSGTKTGTGGTRAQAVADLQRQLNASLAEAGRAVQGQSDAYDAATHHGATQGAGPSQGFPGGSNLTLNCP